MNPIVKKQWLDALESGRYQQTTRQLHVANDDPGSADRFCCLGVLCDLAYRAGVVPRVLNEYSYEYGSEYADMVLPAEVQEWAGLHIDDPTVPSPLEGGSGIDSLAYLNDQGLSFIEIAEKIREHL